MLIAVLLLLSVTSCKNFVESDSAIEFLPHFKMTLTDSVGQTCSFDGKEMWPSMFVYFDPDCEHCSQFLDSLERSMSKFREVNIFLLGLGASTKVNDFKKARQLAKYKNVMLARDSELSYSSKFSGAMVPLILIYKADKRLLAIFRKPVTVDSILIALANK